MWKIRNYFGEKIAFYFAWVGILIMSLWIPAFIGLGVFSYGLYLSISGSHNYTTPLPNTTNPVEMYVIQMLITRN